MSITELLLGCGSNRSKRFFLGGDKDWHGLVTLDFNQDCNPDIIHDLNVLPYPLDDNSFDAIYAFDVLEHQGRQGDWKFFFDQFTEIWRILKPNGLLIASVPRWDSRWAWGDPSHSRVINEGSLAFLSQEEYASQVGRTPMMDYRFYYKADFRLAAIEWKPEQLVFALKAIKDAA